MIDDFGERIEGAAKDRWQRLLHEMGPISDYELARRPLSETFPDLRYASLLKEGADPWMLSFYRAARDSLPAKPGPKRMTAWVRQVRDIRSLCGRLLRGEVDASDVRDKLERQTGMRDSLSGRIALYQRFGHGRSLKAFTVEHGQFTRIQGVRYDPPVSRWRIRNGKAGIDIVAPSLDLACDELAPHIETAGRTRATRFSLYRRRPGNDVIIGKKIGKTHVDLAHFSDETEARDYLRDHRDILEARLEALRAMPAERGRENRSRQGPDRRGGADITPETFTRTFGFRGVQFGNYVGNARRQHDLNDTYDALIDLSDVLGCPPSALSLDGELGLAFGARGRGGRNAGAAHYETDRVVINLTKTQGAGSLAHELFHAIDNHVGAALGGRDSFATATTGTRGPGDMPRAAYDLRNLVTTIARETGVMQRSRQADRYRSSPYFTQPEEVGARCFEAWVIDRLAARGIVNDYLANVMDEEVHAAEARMLGLPEDEDRYTYPKAAEMPRLRTIFLEAFGAGTALSRILDSAGTAPVPTCPEEAPAGNTPDARASSSATGRPVPHASEEEPFDGIDFDALEF